MQAYLKAHNARIDSLFGYSVSITQNGNAVLVGSRENFGRVGINPSSDIIATDSGSAYLFNRSGTTWSQEGYFKATNTASYDHFGQSVAINADGTVIVVGAPYEDSSFAGVNGDQMRDDATAAGSAYVIARSLVTPASIEVFSDEDAEEEARSAGEDSNSGELSGGAIAGIVVIACAPFLVLLIAVLAYMASKRAQVLKSVGGREKNNVAAVFFTLVVVLLVVAGVALVGYALYDYLSFASEETNLIFESVERRLTTISDWEAIDCSVSESLKYAGRGVCHCWLNDGGLWNCTTVNVIDDYADCSIHSSPFCYCNIVYKGPFSAVAWRCAKRSVTEQFESSDNVTDLGLRFLPPRFSDQISSVSPSFSTIPSNAAQFDSFYLLFAEPVPDTTPITVALLVSLVFDFLGLIILGVSALVSFLKWREVLDKGSCKVSSNWSCLFLFGFYLSLAQGWRSSDQSFHSH